jgi:cell division protein FtsB
MNDSYYNGENKYISFSKKIGIIFLVIYVFIILGRSIWTNWYLKKQIDIIKSENTRIEQRNRNLENLIVYYRSSSFKELEARDKLGLKKPDEKVVLVPVRKIDSNNTVEAQILNAKSESKKISNYQAWWAYIFE